MKRIKQTLALRATALFFGLMLALSACANPAGRAVNVQRPGQDRTVNPAANQGADGGTKAAPGTWAVYWYLCGSDLESGNGYGSADLAEMMKVTLPDNVQVIIETGGAAAWENPDIRADKLGRYRYSGNTLAQIAEEPDANMSDPNTLASFLQFCNTNYPAERQVVILWDHGGGSLGGVICDERAEGDAISLTELKSAFAAAPASSGKYEMIGFDACLMATIDTMDVVSDFARYMVAAEESEPGCGWEYSGLFSALSGNTDGAALGKAICDSFYAGCADVGAEAMATLSVLDLSKAPTMLNAFRSLGDEALLCGVRAREAFLSQFGGAALSAENYGGNNKQSGYFNMMDIGDFLANAGDALLPEGTAAVRSALRELVIYQVKGELRSRANGLACFYSYDGGLKALKIYTDIAECPGFEYFYEYAITGDLSAEGRAYVKTAQSAAGQATTDIQMLMPVLGQGTFELSLSPDGRYVLDVGKRVNHIAGVYLHVMYFSEYDGRIDYIDDLGTSHAVNLSRQSEGIFTDEFNGKWAVSRNAGTQAYSNPIYLAVMDRKPGEYTIYATPVLLNGEDDLLLLNFNEASGKYEILGAKKAMDEKTRMADKELRRLVPGDIMIPIQRMAWKQEDGSFTALDWAKPTPEDLQYGGAFTLSDQAEFLDITWIDGYYRIKFEMVDYAGNSYESEAGWYRFDAKGKPAAIDESTVPDI